MLYWVKGLHAAIIEACQFIADRANDAFGISNFCLAQGVALCSCVGSITVYWMTGSAPDIAPPLEIATTYLLGVTTIAVAQTMKKRVTDTARNPMQSFWPWGFLLTSLLLDTCLRTLDQSFERMPLLSDGAFMMCLWGICIARCFASCTPRPPKSLKTQPLASTS